MLSGRGLWGALITRPDESYRLWCVAVCDLENLMNEEAMAAAPQQKKKNGYEDFWDVNRIRVSSLGLVTRLDGFRLL